MFNVRPRDQPAFPHLFDVVAAPPGATGVLFIDGLEFDDIHCAGTTRDLSRAELVAHALDTGFFLGMDEARLSTLLGSCLVGPGGWGGAFFDVVPVIVNDADRASRVGLRRFRSRAGCRRGLAWWR